MPTISTPISQPAKPKRSLRQTGRARSNRSSTSTSTRSAIWSNAASANSSTFAASPPVTRRPRGTTSLSSPPQPSSCGSDDCQQDLELNASAPDEPVVDFGTGPEQHAALAAEIPVEPFQVHEAVRLAGQVGVQRNGHDLGARRAFLEQPLELV